MNDGIEREFIVKLSKFIEETIFEIGLGIHAAKVRAKDIIAVVPGAMSGVDHTEKSYVEFDVTVVVKDSLKNTKGDKAGASGKIEIAKIFNVGVDGSASSEKEAIDESEHTQRINFKVPIWFNGHFRHDKSIDEDRKYVDLLLKENSEE